MTPIVNQQVLTANGEYSFEAAPNGRDVRLEWHITEGSATVTPGYVNLSGGFTPAAGLDGEPPVVPAGGAMYDVGIGNSSLAAIKVENAVDLEMIVCQTVKPLR